MEPPVTSRYVVGIAVTAALGGLLFGFDVAIITGAGPFIERAFDLGDLGLGVAFSSLLFGCVLGAAFAGVLADRIGRRPLLLWVALLFAATTLATGLATNFSTFLIARFLGGLAVGAVSLASPIYVAEVAPTAVRGRLSALYQMAIVTGILVSYLINYLMRNLGDDAWRYMFFTGVAPAVLFFLLVLLGPETPRFLLLKGRLDAAKRVLRRIHGSAEAADREAAAITDGIKRARALAAMGPEPGLRRALGVSVVLAVLIHLAGINTIIDYAPRILASAGFDLSQALLSTLLIGAVNFAFTIVSFFTIDRFGRRPLYLTGSLGMAACLLGLAGFALAGRFEGAAVLLLILLYIVFFCSCIGPVFWTILPELFSDRSRGRALTAPVLTQWVANAVVVLLFPAVFAGLGQAGTFGILAVACLAQAAFTWWVLPETGNRPLEATSSLWRDQQATVDTHAPERKPDGWAGEHTVEAA